MAHRVRRKVIRRPRDEDEVEVEKVVKQEVEDEEDELDEVKEKAAEEDIPEIFRNPIVKKVVVPPPAAKKIVLPTKKREVVDVKQYGAKGDEQEELPLEKPSKDFETKTVNDVVLDNLFIKVMEHLGMGQELVIFKMSGNKWSIKIPGTQETADVGKTGYKYVGRDGEETESVKQADVVKLNKKASKGSGKLVGKEYEQEVCTQAYLDFVEEWRSMDITEKRKYAKSLKCVWEHADDLKIENMHMSAAVQAKKGITKYKPKYQSGKARAAVKG